MAIQCAVCDGFSVVVWEKGVPRAPKKDERDDDLPDCPACNGTGIEPGTDDDGY